MKQKSPGILVLFTMLVRFCCHGQSVYKEQIRMIMVSENHFSSEVDSQYQCRFSSPDNDPNDVTVQSFRSDWTRNTATENPDPPPAVYTNGGRRFAYTVEMINNANNDAFGVFGCTATKYRKKETNISTTRMRSDAEVVPRSGLFTQTVSVDDRNVTISMDIVTDYFLENDLRWRHNTNFFGNSSNKSHPSFGSDTFVFNEPIKLHHAGIYECHSQGRRFSAKHGLNLLIVRACPSTRWAPPACENVCNSCYNGGICDENTGNCVCAPGFTGENCLIACGGNRYGYDCEQKCTYRATDPKDKCRGTLFCLIHPFGCRCNTGFRGLDCDTACGSNTFGASCSQSCHCSSDQCNRYTGECEGQDTRCDPGWTGEFCQEFS